MISLQIATVNFMTIKGLVLVVMPWILGCSIQTWELWITTLPLGPRTTVAFIKPFLLHHQEIDLCVSRFQCCDKIVTSRKHAANKPAL